MMMKVWIVLSLIDVIYASHAATTNLDLEKIPITDMKAYQSSTLSNAGGTETTGEASTAIDGEMNGDFARGSCTHTEFSSPQWWTLDMKEIYDVRQAGRALKGHQLKNT